MPSNPPPPALTSFSQPRPPRSSQILVLASQQILVEPLDSLVSGLLRGEALELLGHVAADREAVDDAAIQVDLVGMAGLL